MFTGIVEEKGKVISAKKSRSNLQVVVETSFVHELQVDQSISHNGVCLTVTNINENSYTVVAIEETLSKSNLGNLKSGSSVNVERCLKMNGRIDGHFVQGHVDTTAEILSIEDKMGSWIFTFSFPENFQHLVVEKGSICVNGVSLTVINLQISRFSVAIIPYTYEHTNFSQLKIGDQVNIEFDILGKYIAQNMVYSSK